MKMLVLISDDDGIRFLFRSPSSGPDLYGSVTDIETESAGLHWHLEREKENIILSEINDISEAICWIRDFLIEQKFISSINELDAVAQMVVHGGKKFKIPTFITDDVLEELNRFRDYAPILMDLCIASINGVRKHFPGIRQIAVFDTAFHHTLPDHAALYPIPYHYIEKYGIRRYGFHGISHKYMVNKAVVSSGIDIRKSNIITIHFGNGCSITAVKNGVSIDTSMGFSPLEGPMMMKRSGSINFDVLAFLHSHENMSWEDLDTMLYRFSGLFGLSGGIHSLGEVISEVEKGNKIATTAYNAFIYSLRKYIGSYMVALGGVDIITLTGRQIKYIPKVRKSLFEDMNQFGIVLDPDRNLQLGDEREGEISSSSSKVKVYYIKNSIRSAIYDEALKVLS